MTPVPVADRDHEVRGDEERAPREVLTHVMALVGQESPLERAGRHDHEADGHRGTTETWQQRREPPCGTIEDDHAVIEPRQLEREGTEHEPEQRVRQRPDEPEPDRHGGTVSRRCG